MKAEELRPLLDPVGCWPPRCHACQNLVADEAEVAFQATGRNEGDDPAPGKELLGLVHLKCLKRLERLGTAIRPPKEPRRGQGAFLTEAALRRFHLERRLA